MFPCRQAHNLFRLNPHASKSSSLSIGASARSLISSSHFFLFLALFPPISRTLGPKRGRRERDCFAIPDIILIYKSVKKRGQKHRCFFRNMNCVSRCQRQEKKRQMWHCVSPWFEVCLPRINYKSIEGERQNVKAARKNRFADFRSVWVFAFEC